MLHPRLYLAAMGLALGAVTPARATTTVNAANSPFTISTANSPFTDPIIVNSGGKLDIIPGGSVEVTDGPAAHAVTLNGGTLTMSGGSVSAANGTAVLINGVNPGTFTMSGGSVTSTGEAVALLNGNFTMSGGSVTSTAGRALFLRGTATISGGSVSGSDLAVVAYDSGQVTLSGGSFSGGLQSFGTDSLLTVVGCNLTLAGGQLAGVLADGTPINSPAIETDLGRILLQSSAPPTIDAPPAVRVLADVGHCFASRANVDLGIAAVNHGCGFVNAGNNAPAAFPVGETVVTWFAIDALGQQATSAQKVMVTDAEKPTITTPADVTVDADPGQSSASLANVRLGAPQTADNCGVASVSNNAPASLPAGTTTVTWLVLDPSGNSAVATQQVTVKTPTQRFADAVQAAQDQVAALSSAGQLTPALRTALTTLLQAFQRVLTGRQISYAQLVVARRDLNATIAGIQTQLASGKLPPALVQTLHGLLSVAQAMARALGP